MASDDPDFERKAADIIALYLSPPQRAAVFCVDEKSAIHGEWGVLLLSIFSFASASVRNQWWFKHSSRKRPLEALHMTVLPGWISSSGIPCSSHLTRKCRLVNSGPLSQRITANNPDSPLGIASNLMGVATTDPPRGIKTNPPPGIRITDPDDKSKK